MTLTSRQAGLREIRLASSSSPVPARSAIASEEERSLKRKADEIADSEDEEDEAGSGDALGVLPDEFLEDSYEPDL